MMCFLNGGAYLSWKNAIFNDLFIISLIRKYIHARISTIISEILFYPHHTNDWFIRCNMEVWRIECRMLLCPFNFRNFQAYFLSDDATLCCWVRENFGSLPCFFLHIQQQIILVILVKKSNNLLNSNAFLFRLCSFDSSVIGIASEPFH